MHYLALTDEEIEAHPRAWAGWKARYHGHDGTRRWWTDLLGAFPPDFSVEFHEVHDMGGNLMLAAGARSCPRRG